MAEIPYCFEASKRGTRKASGQWRIQGGGGGGGAEGAYAPPNKPTQNMNLIIVEQIAMRACATKARIV